MSGEEVGANIGDEFPVELKMEQETLDVSDGRRADVLLGPVHLRLEWADTGETLVDLTESMHRPDSPGEARAILLLELLSRMSLRDVEDLHLVAERDGWMDELVQVAEEVADEAALEFWLQERSRQDEST